MNIGCVLPVYTACAKHWLTDYRQPVHIFKHRLAIVLIIAFVKQLLEVLFPYTVFGVRLRNFSLPSGLDAL